MTTPIIEEAFNKLADLFSDYDLHNQPVMKMQTLEALTTIDQNAREEERERMCNSILQSLEGSPKIKALKSISESFRVWVIKATAKPSAPPTLSSDKEAAITAVEGIQDKK